MIIEFAGPPGSGKSTLNQSLIELFRGEGKRLWSVEEASRSIQERSFSAHAPGWSRQLFWHARILSHALMFSREHRNLLGLVLASQWNRPLRWRDRLWILRRLFKLWGVYRCLQRSLNPDDVVVVDGGLLYFAVALFTSEHEAPRRAAVEAYVRALPRPGLLVVVRAPLEICVGRVIERKRELPRRLQHLSHEAAVAYMTNQADAVDMAVLEAQLCGWQVLAVENRRPLSEVFHELRRSPLLEGFALS